MHRKVNPVSGQTAIKAVICRSFSVESTSPHVSSEMSGNTTSASRRRGSSLVHVDFDVGLRREFITATVLVAILSLATESLASFW